VVTTVAGGVVHHWRGGPLVQVSQGAIAELRGVDLATSGATPHGGAMAHALLWVDHAEFTLNAVTVRDVASWVPRVVDATNGAHVVLTGGTSFSDNTPAEDGVIRLDERSALTVNDAEFARNEVALCGVVCCRGEPPFLPLPLPGEESGW